MVSAVLFLVALFDALRNSWDRHAEGASLKSRESAERRRGGLTHESFWSEGSVGLTQETLWSAFALNVGFLISLLIWLFFGYQLEFGSKPVFVEVRNTFRRGALRDIQVCGSRCKYIM